MSDLLEEVRASVHDRRRADQRYRDALQEARDGGVPMGLLAVAAGVSRQMVLRLTVTPDGKRRKRRGAAQPVEKVVGEIAEAEALRASLDALLEADVPFLAEVV